MSSEEGEPALTPIQDLYWRARESLEAFLGSAKTAPQDGLGDLARGHAAEILPALREQLERTRQADTVRKIFGEEICHAAEANDPRAFARSLEDIGRDPEKALQELKRRSVDVYCAPASWHRHEETEALGNLQFTEGPETIALYQSALEHLEKICAFDSFSSWIDRRSGKRRDETLVEELYDALEPLKFAIEREKTQRKSPLFDSLNNLLGGLLPAALRSREEFLARSRERNWLSCSAPEAGIIKLRLLLDAAEKVAAKAVTTPANLHLPHAETSAEVSSRKTSAWTARQGRDAEFRALAEELKKMLSEVWKFDSHAKTQSELVEKFVQRVSRTSKDRVLRQLRALGLVKKHPRRNLYRIFDKPIPEEERDA